MRTKQVPKFSATRDEMIIIAGIATRAAQMADRLGVDYEQRDALMDIDACHSNGCRLDLTKLLKSDNANFSHDVFGIRRFIDRSTGKLTGCFVPRCAEHQ